jgi:diazepam-binding inhibitor (GABA receptor modulator, acyl-CoA-binding protein)
MSDLEKNFAAAADDARSLPKRPSDDQLLELYALYKQATDGDVTGTRPGMLDFAGRAKYDAWTRKKGTTPDKAMQSYVDFVARLKKG